MKNTNELEHLTWDAKRFLFRPSSYILMSVIGMFFCTIIVFVASSFVIEIDRTVTVGGEVDTSLGTRDIVARSSVVIDKVLAKQGDRIDEATVLATALIGRVHIEQLEMLSGELKKSDLEFEKSHSAEAYQLSRLELDAIEDLQASNFALLLKEKLENYVFQKYQGVIKTKNEILPLERRLVDLRKKASHLRNSKYQKLLVQQLESLMDEMSKLDIQISSEKNQIDSVIRDCFHEVTLASHRLEDYLDNLAVQSRYKSPCAGVLAKVFVEPATFVLEKSVLFRVVPEQAMSQVKALVPSKDIGKVVLGQQVVIKVEAYPYQKYGAFRGNVIEVDHVATGGDKLSDKDKYYIVKVSLSLPENSRVPASEINLVPGMGLQADIVVERKTIYRLFMDRLLGEISSI